MTETTAEELAVRRYVSEAMPDCSFEAISFVERLRSGENHLVFRVSYQGPKGDGHDVVVRAGSGDESERERAHREADVMRKIGGVVGPEVYDFRAECPGFGGPVICMEFVVGHQRPLTEVGAYEMQALGELLQRLHALPLEDLRGWAPADPRLSAYAKERWRAHMAARLPAIREPLPDPTRRRLRAAVDLAADGMEQLIMPRGDDHAEDLSLLHADVSGANIIWSPHPVLIDWEYARLGDAADEVAYLFTQNDLGEEHRADFWRGYSANSDKPKVDDIRERVRLWEPMTLLGSIMWWLEAWSRREAAAEAGIEPSLAKPAEYYLEHAVSRLDRFERMFGAP